MRLPEEARCVFEYKLQHASGRCDLCGGPSAGGVDVFVPDDEWVYGVPWAVAESCVRCVEDGRFEEKLLSDLDTRDEAIARGLQILGRLQ